MSETVRELLVSLSVDSGNTINDIKGLQNAVAQADAKFKAAGAGVKGFETSTAGMQAKVAMLNEKLNAQQAIVTKQAAALDKARAKATAAAQKQQELAGKVDRARDAYNAEVAASGKNSEASQKLAADLTKLEGQYAAQTKSAQRSAQAVQKGEIALEKANAAVKETQSDLAAANAALTKHASVWEQAKIKIAAAGEGMSSAGKKIANTGDKLTRSVTVPVLAAGAAAYAAFNTMDDGLDAVIRKTGATGEALKPLETAYTNVFKGIKTTAGDAGIAVGEVNTRFKATGTQLEETSKDFIRFADVNSTDLNGSIGTTQTILSQWGLGLEGVKGFLGLVTSESQRTGISVDALMESVQKNGATFKGMGLNISQAVQFMADFEAAGINADVSLAALKKSAATYAKDGLSLEDGFARTAAQIKAAKDETAALAIAQQVFGAKGALEMATAIREGRLSVSGLSADMSKMGSVVEDTFNEINGDTPILDKVKNKLVATGATFGKAMLPWIEQAAAKLGGLVDGFANMDASTQQTIITMGGIAAATGPVLSSLGRVAQGAGVLMKAFSGPAGWVTLGVASLVAMGVALSTIKSRSQLLDDSLKGIKLSVDTADVAEITSAIDEGIDAAKTVHDVTVAVNADTAAIEGQLDEIFSDGKVTKKEYKAASKYVNDVVAPDIAEATRLLEEKTAAMKTALDGAVTAEGQPMSEEAKTALITAVQEKTNGLIADLQTAQDGYDALLTQIYKEKRSPTEAEITKLEEYLTKIGVIRAELKLANDEAVARTRADYNKTVSGMGTTENLGGAIGYVQGTQQQAHADAQQRLDDVKAIAGKMADVAAANELVANAEAQRNKEMAEADARAMAGYQAIIDGTTKMAGADDVLTTISQDYDALRKLLSLPIENEQSVLIALTFLNARNAANTPLDPGWIEKYKAAFGPGGDLQKYLNDQQATFFNGLFGGEVAPDLEARQKALDIATMFTDQIGAALKDNAESAELNPVLEAVQAMLNAGALDNIDLTQVDGAMEGIFKTLDLKARGTEAGKEIVPGINVGIGQGAAGITTAESDQVRDAYVNAFRTSFDSHSPSRVMIPLGLTIPQGISAGVSAGIPGSVSAVRSLYQSMIDEANRMRPLLQSALQWSSNGGSEGATSGGAGSSTTKNYSANQYVENQYVSSNLDLQQLMSDMAELNRRAQAGRGHRS